MAFFVSRKFCTESTARKELAKGCSIRLRTLIAAVGSGGGGWGKEAFIYFPTPVNRMIIVYFQAFCPHNGSAVLKRCIGCDGCVLLAAGARD